ncbi:MAG: response regulator transcription factor [Bacteroidota bacterium]
MIRIVIADDHKIVTDGLRLLMQKELDADVIGVAENGLRAFDMVMRLQPDLLLTDLEMDGLDGLELVKKIRETNSATRIMVLSMHNDLHYVNKVLREGANGYLHKNADASILIEGIKRLIDGNQYIDPKISKKMLESYLKGENATDSRKYNLTKRELEIIKLLSQGHNSKKIGELLHISHHTIDSHRKNIHVKLGVKSTPELIRLAMEQQLISK